MSKEIKSGQYTTSIGKAVPEPERSLSRNSSKKWMEPPKNIGQPKITKMRNKKVSNSVLAAKNKK